MPSSVSGTAPQLPRFQPTIYLTTELRTLWAAAILRETHRQRTEFELRAYRPPVNLQPPTEEFADWAKQSVLRFLPIQGAPGFNTGIQTTAMAMLSGAIVENDLPRETIAPYAYLYGYPQFSFSPEVGHLLRWDNMSYAAWMYTESLPKNLHPLEINFPTLMLGIIGLDSRGSHGLTIRDMTRESILTDINQPQLTHAAETHPDATHIPNFIAQRAPHTYTGGMRPATDEEVSSWFNRLWVDCWYNTSNRVDTDYYFDNLGLLSAYGNARRNQVFGRSATAASAPPVPIAEPPSRPRRTTGGNQPPAGIIRAETELERIVRIGHETRRIAREESASPRVPRFRHVGATSINSVVQPGPDAEVQPVIDPFPVPPSTLRTISFDPELPPSNYGFNDWGTPLVDSDTTTPPSGG